MSIEWLKYIPPGHTVSVGIPTFIRGYIYIYIYTHARVCIFFVIACLVHVFPYHKHTPIDSSSLMHACHYSRKIFLSVSCGRNLFWNYRPCMCFAIKKEKSNTFIYIYIGINKLTISEDQLHSTNIIILHT